MPRKEKIKLLLLELLDEEDIQEKIKSIISYGSKAENDAPLNINTGYSEKIQELTLKYEECLKQLEAAKSDLKSSREKYEELSNSNKNIKEEKDKFEREIIRLSGELTSAKNKCGELEGVVKAERIKYSSFSKCMDLYKKYHSLSEEIRGIRLSNVLSDKSEMSFIMSCSNYDNLICVWDYCKSIILSDNKEAEVFEVLREIFYYFFEQLGLSMNSPKYALMDTRPGEELDDQFHVRCKNSRVSGIISDVYLKGIIQTNNNAVKRQSIVFVRGI